MSKRIDVIIVFIKERRYFQLAILIGIGIAIGSGGWKVWSEYVDPSVKLDEERKKVQDLTGQIRSKDLQFVEMNKNVGIMHNELSEAKGSKQECEQDRRLLKSQLLDMRSKLLAASTGTVSQDRPIVEDRKANEHNGPSAVVRAEQLSRVSRLKFDKTVRLFDSEYSFSVKNFPNGGFFDFSNKNKCVFKKVDRNGKSITANIDKGQYVDIVIFDNLYRVTLIDKDADSCYFTFVPQ